MSTPMMQQWHSCKEEAEGQLLLFRLGDFYEAFYEDAKLLSEALDITLTKRGDIPMSGIPSQTLDTYLERLVSRGFRIAIAEQVEEAKLGKGLVRREIVRVITPGTWYRVEHQKTSQYLASLCQVGSLFGLALLDITTGLFQTTELDKESDLINEIYRIDPKELISTQTFADKHPLCFQDHHTLFPVPSSLFDHETASRCLTEHFHLSHLDSFGMKGMVAAINAAGALLRYVKEHLHLSTTHLTSLSPYAVATIMGLDRSTLRHLELIESISPGGPTLLKTLDMTLTAMGGRLLREWIKRPLLEPTRITQRQEAIEVLVQEDPLRHVVRTLLRPIHDLERLVTKIVGPLPSPRDLTALSASLQPLPALREALLTFSASLLQTSVEALGEHSASVALFEAALLPSPPLRIGEGELFRTGYDAVLDALRTFSLEGKEWLARYQTQLREETGAKTLKISYHKVFGYTIEVSRGQAAALPPSFERRQTLANAERFTTPKLKEFEERLLSAEEQILTREKELFAALIAHVVERQHLLLTTARSLAHIDCFQSLADVARKNNYTKPIVDTSDLFVITEGRHPVIEQIVGRHQFIPNDLALGREQGKMLLLTGPNMAGKSTYMRQAALIAVMAQMGSFVPARTAHLGIVDKIFTRIGASDDLARGQSTFMVEMHETAHILHHATSRSLVILDEIGRGTSTYDGIAIAWAVAEYLLLTKEKTAKTLFATHYAELADLSKTFVDVRHAHAVVEEREGTLFFTHRILPGVAQNSYGIHVAKLAGLPPPLIKRAQEILKKFETKKGKATHEPHAQQLLLF